MKIRRIIIVAALTIAMITLLSACSLKKECQHQYTEEITQKATCVSEGIKTYTCSLCGDSYTETIMKIDSNWSVDYYVDEFGDKTSDAFALGTFKGSFSNSATTGSDLTVYVYVDMEHLDFTDIRLMEYGNMKANFKDSDTVTIKTKNADGETKSFSITPYNGDLCSTDVDLANTLQGSEELNVVITSVSRYGSESTYHFKMDNIGLSDILE